MRADEVQLQRMPEQPHTSSDWMHTRDHRHMQLHALSVPLAIVIVRINARMLLYKAQNIHCCRILMPFTRTAISFRIGPWYIPRLQYLTTQWLAPSGASSQHDTPGREFCTHCRTGCSRPEACQAQ